MDPDGLLQVARDGRGVSAEFARDERLGAPPTAVGHVQPHHLGEPDARLIVSHRVVPAPAARPAIASPWVVGIRVLRTLGSCNLNLSLRVGSERAGGGLLRNRSEEHRTVISLLFALDYLPPQQQVHGIAFLDECCDVGVRHAFDLHALI